MSIFVFLRGAKMVLRLQFWGDSTALTRHGDTILVRRYCMPDISKGHHIRSSKQDLHLWRRRRNFLRLVTFTSCSFKEGQKLRKACGSPSYAAPEIVARRPYNPTGMPSLRPPLSVQEGSAPPSRQSMCVQALMCKPRCAPRLADLC